LGTVFSTTLARGGSSKSGGEDEVVVLKTKFLDEFQNLRENAEHMSLIGARMGYGVVTVALPVDTFSETIGTFTTVAVPPVDTQAEPENNVILASSCSLRR
jgi:hypothetical protein